MGGRVRMRSLTLASILIALALPASATNYRDVATLRSWDNQVVCSGQRYWNEQRKRTFWTEGTPCALTYTQCVTGYVDDVDGAHKVLSCSPDIDNSRGRKAVYK